MFWKRKKEKQEETQPENQSATEEQQTSGEIDTDQQSEATAQGDTQSEPNKPKQGLFAKLRDRLKATRESITQKALNLFRGGAKINEDLLEDLEEVLITADVGVDTTMAMMDELRDRIRREKKANTSDAKWLTDTLRELMNEMLEQGERGLYLADEGPSIYLVIGVNGVGKTTAIGKLAYRCIQEGKKVMLVAADTFRAAAIEQLVIWAERAGASIVTGEEKSDPSSVVYRALERVKQEKPDVVIIDTAGRLHTKSNLLQELSKMSRVISREYEDAPHETLLVLDASTGQNALLQAKTFLEACGVTGLILTKLDGTARGGVVLSVHKELNLPVKFIGVGEGIEDLEPFDPQAFSRALFQLEEEEVTS